MPVLVYKRMDVPVSWAQIRRIRCAHCPDAYSYVTGGGMTLSTLGAPVVTSDDRMRGSISKSLGTHMGRLARRKSLGIARCARCGRWQPWMARDLGLRSALWSLVPLVFAWGALYVATSPEPERPVPGWFWVAAIGAVPVVAAGAFLVVRHRLGSPGERDPRSMRDDELRAFLDECDRDEVDPALAWHFGRVANREPGEGRVVVSLGIDDRAGGFDVPESLRTEVRLQAAATSCEPAPIDGAGTAAVPERSAYSVAYETELEVGSSPGGSRARDFQGANETLLRAMAADADLAEGMRAMGIDLRRTPMGRAPRTPPRGWLWHHAQQRGVMHLVPRHQHTAESAWWDALHPDGVGGRAIAGAR